MTHRLPFDGASVDREISQVREQFLSTVLTLH